MKVKVFTPNKNGKIEFSRKELEVLLDEIYNSGWEDGRNYNGSSWWWTSPTAPPYCTYSDSTGQPSWREYISVTNGTSSTKATTSTTTTDKGITLSSAN